MTALYILLGMAAVITCLACLRLTLILDAEEELSLTAKVLCFRLKLLPKVNKPPNLRSFRIKAFRRRRLKEEKRHRKKELDRAAATLAKEKKKAADQAAGQEAPKRTLKDNVAFGIDLIKYVVLRVLKTFGKRLRVDVHRMEITVATGDAAKTAITFGYVSQGVAYLTALLDRYFNIRYPAKGREAIAVRVDYLAEKSTFKVHMVFHIRVWQVVSLGVAALKGYLAMPKHKPAAKPQDKPKPEPSEATPKPSTPSHPTKIQNENAPEQAGKEV